MFDHLWPLGGPRTRPALECWTLLAAVAAQVGQGPGGFRVGTLVTRAGLRAPALVARMAAGVGQVAGAPPIVGVGRGDLANRAENLAFGLPFGDAAERALAVEATVAALRGHLAAADGIAPLDRLRVWVGGNGPGARELAGRAGRRLERLGAHPGGAGRRAGRGARDGRGGRTRPGRRRRLLGRAGAGGARAPRGRGRGWPAGARGGRRTRWPGWSPATRRRSWPGCGPLVTLAPPGAWWPPWAGPRPRRGPCWPTPPACPGGNELVERESKFGRSGENVGKYLLRPSRSGNLVTYRSD